MTDMIEARALTKHLGQVGLPDRALVEIVDKIFLPLVTG